MGRSRRTDRTRRCRESWGGRAGSLARRERRSLSSAVADRIWRPCSAGLVDAQLRLGEPPEQSHCLGLGSLDGFAAARVCEVLDQRVARGRREQRAGCSNHDAFKRRRKHRDVGDEKVVKPRRYAETGEIAGFSVLSGPPRIGPLWCSRGAFAECRRSTESPPEGPSEERSVGEDSHRLGQLGSQHVDDVLAGPRVSPTTGDHRVDGSEDARWVAFRVA